MLLADVGMEDEQDRPVKETKKGKQGKLVREDEEIEVRRSEERSDEV